MTAAQAAAVAEFTQLRLQASALLAQAAQLPALPQLHRAQAESAASLAGLRLHRIYGMPLSEDFLALKDDVEAVAKAADKLIAAIGDEAHDSDNSIDLILFTHQLTDALDGNALYVLDKAAERCGEDREAGRADHFIKLQAAE